MYGLTNKRVYLRGKRGITVTRIYCPTGINPRKRDFTREKCTQQYKYIKNIQTPTQYRIFGPSDIYSPDK